MSENYENFEKISRALVRELINFRDFQYEILLPATVLLCSKYGSASAVSN
jgi:hypothetical protein